MDEGSQQLMVELKEAMDKMPNDSQGLAGWLLSHYSLVKKGTAEPTTFHRANPKQNGPPASNQELRWAGNQTQTQFAKNAGLDKINKNPEWSEMIKAVNSVNDGLYGQAVDQSGNVEIEEETQDTGLTFEQKQQVLAEAARQKGGKLTTREAKGILDGQSGSELYVDMQGNAIVGSGDGAVNANEIKAAANIVSNMFDADESDVLKSERMKRLRSQYAFQNGGAGKLGFSRGS